MLTDATLLYRIMQFLKNIEIHVHCPTISTEGIRTGKSILPRPIIVEMDLQFAETGYSRKGRIYQIL
jgi:hypothetical protein